MSSRKVSTGLVLGKFMPPHLGHVYLGQFASAYVDELTVLIDHPADEAIPGAQRLAWMRELLPSAAVHYIAKPTPQQPEEHPQFWDVWKATVREYLPDGPDFVFASEAYGGKLAEVLGAQFVPVDLQREAISISATQIREDPFKYWEYLPSCVRPHYTKRICVFGPESTGKSTLAKRLAAQYATIHVPEYARTWLEAKGGVCTFDDMVPIACGQLAATQASARQANRILFSDTDVLATVLWSEELFGSCPDWIREQARNQIHDLYLVQDIDVPWVADPVRYFPQNREQFFWRCTAILDEHKARYVIVRGDWEERFRKSCEAVDLIRSL